MTTLTMYTGNSEDSEKGEKRTQTSLGKLLVEQLQNKSPLATVLTKNKDLLLEILQTENYRQLKTLKDADKQQETVNCAICTEQNRISERKTHNCHGQNVIKVGSISARTPKDFEAEQCSLNQAMLATVTSSQPDLLEILLKAGADINCSDKWCPVITTVVDLGNLELFNVIKSCCLDINTKTYSGSLLHSAVRSRSFEMVKEVHEVCVAEGVQYTSDDTTPLHVAVQNILLICRKLCDTCKSDNKQDLQGLTKSKPQFSTEAVGNFNKYDETEKYDFRIIKYLLEKGFSVNEKDYKSRTVLHAAAIHANRDLVAILLKAGADKLMVDRDENPPWFYFAFYGHTYLLDILVDLEDVEKYFYIHQLAKVGNLKGLQYLIAKGADVLLINPDGRTALYVAVQNKETDCIKELLNHPNPGLDGVNSTEPFEIALKRYYEPSILKLFLQRGQNINIEYDCMTPLLQNIYSPDVVEWLLDHGADPNFITSDGNTAIIAVCEAEDFEEGEDVLHLLLCHNVDIGQTQLCSSEGLTPLQSAIGTNGRYGFVKLCLAAGFSMYNIHEWFVKEYLLLELLVSEDIEPRFRSLFEYVKMSEYSPTSLKGFSRLCVLKCLGSVNVTEKIKSLGLPTILEDFLDWETYLKLRNQELDMCFKAISATVKLD